MQRFLFWRHRAATATRPAGPRLELPDHVPFSPAKDRREMQRLREQHTSIQQELHGNYTAPLVAPTAILDIACGTGLWALEMAHEFPQARVVGLDIIMPDPTENLGPEMPVVPPNVTFMQGDATQPLPFPDASFDYVHLCLLYAVMPAPHWPALLREGVRLLRPGGWLESVEALPFPKKNERAGMATVILWFSELLRHRGADPLAALKIVGWLRDMGLTHVTARETTTDDGVDDQADAIASATALIDYIRAPVIEAGIAAPEQFEAVAAQALAELHRSSRESGFNTYVAYGQRPTT